MKAARFLILWLALLGFGCASENDPAVERTNAHSATQTTDATRLPEVRYYSLSDT